MASNLLTDVVEHELPLSRKPNQPVIPIELIRSRKTASAAFTLACDCSGLEDKEIYLPLGIDAGYFSRIKKGDATLQADLIQKFCDHVGNTVYAEWIAYQVGGTIVQIESETQRLLRLAKEELAKERQERQVIEDTLHRIITGANQK
jgi:hypothetical protein